MAINPLSFSDEENQDSTGNNNFRNNIGGGGDTGVGNVNSGSGQITNGAAGNFTSSAGVSSGAGGSAGGLKSPGTPSSSGSFTNLQNYLNANSDQSSGLGSKIDNSIQNEANQGFSDLGNATSQFNNDVNTAYGNSNNVTTGQIGNILNTAANNPSALQNSDEQTIKNIENTAQGAATSYATENEPSSTSTTSSGSSSTTPSTSSSTSGTTGTTSSTTTPSYNPLSPITNQDELAVSGAPQNLTNYNSYNTGITDLQNTANDAQLLGTEAGQQTLLQQNYARPDYNQGEQQLDQLLLGGNQANQTQFAALQNSLLGPNPNAPNSNAQVSDYTQYSGPSGTIQGQEAQAQYNAANTLNNAQTNLGNDYNTILSYLYGTAVPTLTNNTPAIGANVANPTTGYLNPATAPTTAQTTALAPGAVAGGLYGQLANNVTNDVAAANAQNAADEQSAEVQDALGYYQQGANTYNQNVAAQNAQIAAEQAANPNQRYLNNDPAYFTAGQVINAFENPQYVTSTEGPATTANGATAADIAQINALNNLANTTYNPITNMNQLNINGTNQTVGTGYDPTQFNVNAQQAWANLLASTNTGPANNLTNLVNPNYTVTVNPTLPTPLNPQARPVQGFIPQHSDGTPISDS